MFNGSKGKGKGKGGNGHTLPRQRLSVEKFMGTVTNWKGKYGWIEPAETIQHPKASQRNGNLFVSIEDCLTGGLEIGAQVNFHISEDESGLLAEEVSQLTPGKPLAKGMQKGGFKGGAGKGGFQNNWSKGGYQDNWSKGGKGVMQGFGKAGKGGKGFRPTKEGGKGHLLSTNRLSTDKFMGTVKAWKGKFGWITPMEEIAHPKAKEHQGSIFVSMTNLVGRTDLTVGATVDFHIAEDSSGLGAEEVVQY